MKKQMGASLIEAMVAVLIVGFGLLGVGAMQSRAIAMNQSAHYRGIAADLAADLAERVRALRSPFMADDNIAVRPPAPPDFSLCTENDDFEIECGPQTNGSDGDLLAREMSQWNDLRRSQLPGSSFIPLALVPGGTSGYFRYTLTLTWPDKNADCTLVPNPCSYSVVIE
jgi:type IV pilus assembly protein PilV